MNRRSFIVGLSSLVGTRGHLAFAETGKPNLRVGVLSDIHVTALANANWFEKALRRFDADKVDAVLVTGDLGTWGKIRELEAVAETWFKVFPNDRRSDGGKVTRLFVTGNHDVEGWAYAGAKNKTLAEAREDGFFFRREEVWDRLFHERYEPVMVREVNGYTFVLRNWLLRLGGKRTAAKYPFEQPYDDEPNPLKEVLARLGDRLSGRTFFYVQHDPMDNTVNAHWLLGGKRFGVGQDNGYARSCLKGRRNCLALTGHSHFSLTDEESIWQGEFTAVNCSCARGFAFTRPGHENGFAVEDFNRKPPFEMDRFDHGSVRQGMVMDVFDDHVRFERFDLTYGLSLGPDWVVPLFAGGATVPPSGVPKYDFKARAAAVRPPCFAADAKVTVSRVEKGYRRVKAGTAGLDKGYPHPQLRVTFPPVTTARSPSRGFDFRVVCSCRADGQEVKVQERRVFSPNVYQAEARDVEPCVCNFPVTELQGRGEVRFTVVPYDCWGTEGAPLVSEWVKV